MLRQIAALLKPKAVQQQNNHLRKIDSRHKWNALETAISFSIANNIVGDYLEFGVYKGDSFIQAFHYYEKIHARYCRMNKTKQDDFLAYQKRYFAFDSFAGLPTNVEQKDLPLHWKGSNVMSCSQQVFMNNLMNAAVDLERVHVVDGYYENSLSLQTIEQHQIRKAAVINIDCDLYESTVNVFDFITPLLVEGSVIYFDDWFYYAGHPDKGERGAFSNWLKQNPQFTATELCKFYPAACYVISSKEHA